MSQRLRNGWPGVVLLLLAVLLPTAWLTGGAGPDDPRHLELGALFLRTALALLGVFFIATTSDAEPRDPRPGLGMTTLLGLGVLAAVFRLVHLGAPLWFDEIWLVVDTLRQPLGDIVRTFGSDNNHPLYSLCAWFSVAVFGESAWALRLPAAVFGVLGVVALGVYGGRWVGRRSGLAAALLLAVSVHHVGFSQEARGYSGLLLLTIASTHFLLDALATRRRCSWVLYGLTLGLATYVHLTAVFLAIGHVAILLRAAWRARRGEDVGVREGLLGLVLGALVGLALHALILPQMLHWFLLRPKGSAPSGEWKDPLWSVKAALTSFGLPSGLAWGFVLGGLAGFALCARALWKRSPDTVIAFVVPVGALVTVLLGMGRNLWPRLIFFAAGFLLLLALAGLRSVCAWIAVRYGKPRPERLALIVLAVLAVASTGTVIRGWAHPKQDFPAAMAWVDEHRGDDPVLTVGLARYPYQEYYDAGYVWVEGRDHYLELVPAGGSAYVLDTLPIWLDANDPELRAQLGRDAVEVARFRGSKGGGDVIVYRVEDRP